MREFTLHRGDIPFGGFGFGDSCDWSSGTHLHSHTFLTRMTGVRE